MKSILLGYVIQKINGDKIEYIHQDRDGDFWNSSAKNAHLFKSVDDTQSYLNSYEFTKCPILNGGAKVRKPMMLDEGLFTIKILPVVIYDHNCFDPDEYQPLEFNYDVITWNSTVQVTQMMKIDVTHVKIILNDEIKFDSSKG
jgi:hypothetical protein